MDRNVIIDFQARVSEARDVLEAANQREAQRLEVSMAETNSHLAEMRVRHSELLTFVKDMSRKMEHYVNDTMQFLIEREIDLQSDYDQRMTELRGTPAPKLVISK